MPQFSYKATDSHGKIVKGQRSANSPQELAVRLRRSGMELLTAKAVSTTSLFESFQGIQFGSVSRTELIEFSNSMGVMLKAGVPLVEALVELREDETNRYFKNILDDIVEQVEGGDPLNKAIKKHSRAFPEIYSNVVEIGENTGQLDKSIFRFIASFQANRRFDEKRP